MAEFEIISESIPVSMHEDWFDIATEEHFWMQWRFGVFKKLIQAKKINIGNKILEIGCGSGIFRKQVETDFNINVDGCDLNTNALKVAEKGKGRLMLYNIYDKNSRLIGKYDSIFLMDVVEHIKDDIDFLKIAATHVKPGGIIFLNVPAGMYLFSKYDKKVGHIRRYNKKSMKDLITKAGLESMEISYWAALLIPLGILRKYLLELSSDKNIIKDGFKPPGKVAHAFLKILKQTELALSFNLPIGASLMAIAKVPD